jgi:hypothetical protein
MSANGGSTTFRNIPDVALTADNILVYYGNGTNGEVGGTSCAAPLWAGLAALMNEQAAAAGKSTVGFLNPALYALGGNASYAGFHDITTGNNFSSASPSSYSAVTGYDLCTGWGTPAGQNLINAIAGVPDSIGILPAVGLPVTGLVGGPFVPAGQPFTLTNSGSGAVSWSLTGVPAWLTVTSMAGSLAPKTSVSLAASENLYAAFLPAGIYTGSLSFNDLTTGVSQGRQITFQIGQSVVQNGGFETGDFSDWTLVGAGVSGNYIYNAVESVTSYSDTVHSGNYGAFLGDTSLATLSQNLTTVPGQNYLVSFWLDNPVTGSGQAFQVNWNTNAASTNRVFSLASPPAFSWTNLALVLTATGTNTVLQFGAANPPNYFGLDDVSATPVPVPSIIAAGHNSNSFNLTCYAVAGVNYQVLCSTNLITWNPVSTNTATGSTLSITNKIGVTGQKFYRVLQLP